MKEAAIFEAWANRLVEGTWATPDTPEKQTQLVQLMSAELPVGADATNATEQLYDLIGDDELFDRLQALADRDANADARQTVYDRMQELANDPDIAEVMTQFTMDMDTPAEPAEPVDEIKNPADQTEDPADTEQPKYPEYQDDLATILKNAGVDDTVVRAAPDYELEVDETANPGVTPADIDGTAEETLDEGRCNMSEAGTSCPVHGLNECGMEEDVLEGQYNGKDTVQYRGIFYVNQPDGSWSSLRGDHVAEPAVKRVLDKMHQQSTMSETFIDPNSEYGVNAQGDYVDLKKDAKINANAKAAAAAQAFNTVTIGPDTRPNPGGRFFGAGGGSGSGSGGGSSSAESSTPMGGPIPTSSGASSSGAKPMGQMPAKNMGAVQTATPKLPEDDMDEDYTSDSNARSSAGLAGAAAGGIAGGTLGSLAGPAGAMGGAALGAALGGAAGVSSANKDLATAHSAEMQRQADKRTKFVPVGPYNTDKPPPVIAVDTGKYPGLVPLQNKDQPKATIEDTSPLKGQYGHSGKMKPVEKDVTFLDRLKELSGMMRK
jgi:hypothetical protein